VLATLLRDASEDGGGITLQSNNPRPHMSHEGQSLPKWAARSMSAFLPMPVRAGKTVCNKLGDHFRFNCQPLNVGWRGCMQSLKSSKSFHSGSGGSQPDRGAYIEASMNCIVGM